LHSALAKFQAEYSAVPRTAQGSFGPYTDLAQVLAVVQKANELGLTVVQTFEYEGGSILTLRTTLYHVEGESITSVFPISLAQEATKRNTRMQVLGAEITYVRRYATMAILGLASEDTENSRTPEATLPDHVQPQQTPDPNDDFGL
jgi:hypothetical protein